MEKNEILKKARAREGADEMEVQVNWRGSYIALSVGGLACIGLYAFEMRHGQSGKDLMCLYFAMAAVQNLYGWYRLRKSEMLVYFFAFGALAAWNLWSYLSFVFG